MPVTRATVGSDVTLKCDGLNYFEIDWYKNGVWIEIGNKNFSRFHSNGNGSHLHIDNVTRSDNGTYNCTFIALYSAYQTVELRVEGVYVFINIYQFPYRRSSVSLAQ